MIKFKYISILSVWTLSSFLSGAFLSAASARSDTCLHGDDSVSGSSVPADGAVSESSLSAAAPTLDLTLEQCQELAARNSAAVLNAGLDVEAAKAQKREAVAEYFPKVSLNAWAFYAFDPMIELGLTDILGDTPFVQGLNSTLEAYAQQFGFSTVYSTLKKGVTANVSVMQSVFAGWRIVTGNKLAALGLSAASLQRDIALRTSAEDVERNYWQVISLEEKEKTLAEASRLLDTLYRDVLAATEAGLAVETDLLQVKMRINELRVDGVRLRNGIRLSKMNLLNTVGVEYNPYSTFGNDSIPYIDDIRLTDSLSDMQSPENYFRVAEDAAMAQEEAALLDISVESKRLEKQMAMGEALPQIAVGASYGYNDFINKGSMNGMVFGMVKIPITDWGGTARKMQRIDAQMRKAENDRAYLQRQLTLQIHQLWMDLTASWEQLQVAMEDVAMAEALQEKMYSQYEAGMSPMSELLEAQTGLSEARSGLTDSRIAYRMAVRAYLDRVGN